MSLLHSLDGELRLFVGLPEMPKHFLYLSMKLGRNKLERLMADSIFLLVLNLMIVICMLAAWKLMGQ